MTTSAVEERIKKVRTTDDKLVVALADGRTLSVPLAWYPRLLNASAEQRNDWRLISGGHGVHWPQIDEDLSVDGLLRGVPAPDAHSQSSSVEGAQQWLGTLESLAQQIRKQQQTSQQMVQELMNTYMQLLNTSGSYLFGQAEQQQTLQQTAQQWMEQIQQQQQTFQQAVQESLNTYAQLFNIPASYAQKSLQDARHPIGDYDQLSAEEVSQRLEGLSTEELRTVRDYEERHSNRSTVLQELDRKIMDAS